MIQDNDLGFLRSRSVTFGAGGSIAGTGDSLHAIGAALPGTLRITAT